MEFELNHREPLVWPDPSIPSWPCFSANLGWTMASGKQNNCGGVVSARDLQECFNWLAQWQAKYEAAEGGWDFRAEIVMIGVLPFFPEWFGHATRPEGRDDSTIMAHFNEYVDWVEALNEKEPHRNIGTEEKPVWHRTDRICLMGAEDRWRWRGETDDDPPPCRCKGCTASGLVRIRH